MAAAAGQAMSGVDRQSLAVGLAAAEQARKDDPLRHFRCMSWAQERLIIEGVLNCHDVYLHGGNGSSKTTSGVFCELALCTGLESVIGYHRQCPECRTLVDPFAGNALDCPRCSAALEDRVIEIPVLEPPVRWGIGFPSYKISAGSTLAMIRKLLGKRKFVEVRQGNRNTVAQILIPHRLSPDQEEPDDTWSEIFMFPYDGEVPEGVRLDGFHCDEPPPAHFLDALRTRRTAGRKFRRWITATPIDAKTWAPILEQYPAELLKPENGRIRMQTSLYDNKAMTPEDIKGYEDDLRGSPLRQARLMGDHVDASGMCPFDTAILDEWLARCVPGKAKRITGFREVDTAEGKKRVRVSAEIEAWEEYDPTDVYLVTADTGKGIRSGEDGKRHDPDCAHVYSRRKKKLVARFNDYIGGYGLGFTVLAALGKMYGNARVDAPRTGGYGESVFSGLRDAGYRNLFHEMKEDQRGKWNPRLGFNETRTTNSEWRETVEDLVDLSRDGVTALTIPSSEVVQCLKDLIVDENGKVLAAAGKHDEDWVCLGRAAYLLVNRKVSAIRAPETPTIAEWVNQSILQRKAGTFVQELW